MSDTTTHHLPAPIAAAPEPLAQEARRLTRAKKRARKAKARAAAQEAADGLTKAQRAIRKHAETLRLSGGRYALPGPALTPESGLPRLLDMLTYMRPAGSATEESFIADHIDSLDSDGFAQVWTDGFGNRIAQVGDNPHIMWSAHTDTVHRSAGRGRTFTSGPMVYSDGESCLGADDTAGVWLLCEMVRAGVPGLYVWHREEEIGGHGSTYVARQSPKLVDGISACIALDRKGRGDVITHQGGRCCSDAFAESLAAILGGEFAPDETGIFTDSANYTDLIGECTNLSVGYHAAHGPTEHLDLAFVVELRDRLISADWTGLVFEREPGEAEEWPSAWGRPGSSWDSSYGSNSGGSLWRDGGSWRSSWRDAPTTLEELVSDYPARVAQWLDSNGITLRDLAGDIGVELDDDSDRLDRYWLNR